MYYALKDFKSVVKPDFITTSDSKGSKIYKGIAGDRRVILRENDGGNSDRPTIEISYRKGTDKIFYMGKWWRPSQ